jgi:hypothetical protein
LISFRSFIDLKSEPSQDSFERKTQAPMPSSYNDNTILYVPSAGDTDQRRNPPLRRSGSGQRAPWPTPSTRAGASMLSGSRKTAAAIIPVPAISPSHVPSDASDPGQAGATPGPSPSIEAGED